MPWIRRNLFFVIGLLVALGLLGGAIYFLLDQRSEDAQVDTDLEEQWGQLKNFYGLPTFPNEENVKAAAQDKQKIMDFLRQVKGAFQPIPPVQFTGDQGFRTELEKMVAQLNADARAANVVVPTNYYYSFQSQKTRMNFRPEHFKPWAQQMAEVQALCQLLFAAKVPQIDGIQRARIGDEDSGGGTGGGAGAAGPQGEGGGGMGDYVNLNLISNNVVLIYPYRLNFTCFSTELSEVINALMSSPNGFLIETIKVESPELGANLAGPAGPEGAPPGGMPPAEAAPTPPPADAAAAPAPDGAAAAPAPAAPTFKRFTGTAGGKGAGKKDKGGLVTVLNERPLKVSLLVYVINMKGGEH